MMSYIQLTTEKPKEIEMRRLRKFLLLSGSERWLLIKAALLLVSVRLGLGLLPLQTLRRVLARLTDTSLPLGNSQQFSFKSVVWAVETAGRLMPWARTCLTQAIVAQVLLLRRGYSAELHIGVLKHDEDQFLAHAWVESGAEVVLGDHELERYTPLTTWGANFRCVHPVVEVDRKPQGL